MNQAVRLTLLSHGMTEAMSAGRFPTDEALNAVGIRQVGALTGPGRFDRVLSAPERRTRQTAELLGWNPDIDNRLADVDCGAWRGSDLDSLPADELSHWLTDPGAAPHGGESVIRLLERVRGWLDTISCMPTSLLAVTHPAIVRAAVLVTLDAPPGSFWRIDVAPASRTVLNHRTPSWTLRLGVPGVGCRAPAP